MEPTGFEHLKKGQVLSHWAWAVTGVLRKNNTLVDLSLDLNAVGDKGGSAFCPICAVQIGRNLKHFDTLHWDLDACLIRLDLQSFLLRFEWLNSIQRLAPGL